VSTPNIIVELIEPGHAATTAAWLGTLVRVNWPLNELPRAELGVTLGYGWGVRTGEDPETHAPIVAALDTLIADDWQVRVRTTGAVLPATNAVLFEGWLEGAQRGANENGHSTTLHLVSLGDILRTEHHVHGQYWLDKGEEAVLAANPAALVRPRLVTALDAVFNFAARNSRPPINVTHTLRFPAEEGQPGYYRFPLFTHFADPRAMFWNWSRVFAYLLALPGIDFTLGQTPQIKRLSRLLFQEFPVELDEEQPGMDGQTLLQRIHMPSDPEDPESPPPIEMDPEADAAPSDPWGQILCARPHKLSIEGMSWLDALHHCCIRAGISTHWLNRIAVTGAPPNQTIGYAHGYRFILPHAAKSTVLHLPSPKYRTDNKTWATVEAAANVIQLDWREDYGRIINSGRAIGAARDQEVTVNLAPGWAANADWDVNPANPSAVEAAVAAIGGETWRAKYDIGGSQVVSGQTGLVGRMWGVNTFGAWTAYGRGYAPFDEAQYAVFDLADVYMAAWDAEHMPPEYTRDQNAPRPRVWRPCLTGWTPRDPWAPFTEVSFDSGTTWRPLEGVNLSTRDLRITLTSESLADVLQYRHTSPPSGISFAEAYVRGLLRIRVTAVIDSDAATAFDIDDIMGPPPPDSPSLRLRRTLLERRSDWLIRQRDDALYGNSQFNRVRYPSGPNYPAAARDDEDGMWAELGRLRLVHDRLRSAGPVTLPGLVFPVINSNGNLTAGYRPGDCVTKLDAAGASPADPNQALCEIDLAGRETERGAVIAAVRWDYGVEPPTATTTLALEDQSRFIELMGMGRPG